MGVCGALSDPVPGGRAAAGVLAVSGIQCRALAGALRRALAHDTE